MTESTTTQPERIDVATKALTYYGSADPKTIATNDSTTGEKYSVLEAASGLAAALRLFLDDSLGDASAVAIAEEHFAGYPADKLPSNVAWAHLAQSLRDVAVRAYRAGEVSAHNRAQLTTPEMLARLGVDFRPSVDDEGEASYFLVSQHIARDED